MPDHLDPVPDHSDPAPGPQSSNEEPQAHLTPTPHGGGWRMFSAPVEVEAFLGQTWVNVLVDGIDDESAEIWARWPPAGSHRRRRPPPGDRRFALPSTQGRLSGRLTAGRRSRRPPPSVRPL